MSDDFIPFNSVMFILAHCHGLLGLLDRTEPALSLLETSVFPNITRKTANIEIINIAIYLLQLLFII